MPVTGTEKSAQFEALLMPVLDAAYRLARSMTHNASDAEDLVQEAAVRAFVAFDSFQAGTNFKAWFLRIMVNRFLNDRRSQERRPSTVEIESVPEQHLFHEVERSRQFREADPARAFLKKLNEEDIMRAFAALPDEFRLVAALYFQEELTYEDIAAVLEIPVGTVRSRLHRARKLLQKALWDVARE